MADRVIQRNDTAARWQSINPVLAQGELGIVSDGAKGYKIGDGVTAWNNLEYPANPASVVQGVGDSETAVISQKGITDLVIPSFSQIAGFGLYSNTGRIDTTGQIQTSTSGLFYTDPLYIREIPQIVVYGFSSDNTSLVAFYTEDGTFISSINGADYENKLTVVQVPSNAYTCRCTGYPMTAFVFYRGLNNLYNKINKNPYTNVTKEYPPSAGYYNLQTARAAIPIQLRRGGHLISFLASEQQWQFWYWRGFGDQNNTDSGWNNDDLWVRVTDATITDPMVTQLESLYQIVTAGILDASNYKLTEPGFIDYTNGLFNTIGSNVTAATVDYIPCKGAKFIEVSMTTGTNTTVVVGNAFYDKNKAYISGNQRPNSTTTGRKIVRYSVPTGAEYFRTSYFNEVNRGTYGEFSCKVLYESGDNYDKVSLDSRELSDGYGVYVVNGENYNAGDIYTSTMTGVTSFIDCEGVSEIELSMIILTTNPTQGCAFYNKNKEFISGVLRKQGSANGSEVITVQVPGEAAYFKTVYWNFENRKTYGEFVCNLSYPHGFLGQGKYRPYQDGLIHYSVKVNQSVSNFWDNANSMQDSENYLPSTGVLLLPSTYTPNGKPTKLIMYCHGMSNPVTYTQWGNPDSQYFMTQKQRWADMGYAVFDCNGPKDNNGNPVYANGAPQSVAAYRASLDYIKQYYNVDPDIYVVGGSMGGDVALNYCFTFSDVRALAMISGWTDLYNCGWLQGVREPFVTYYGFNNQTTYEQSKVQGYDPSLRIVNIGGTPYLFGFKCPLKYWVGSEESASVLYKQALDTFIPALKNAQNNAVARVVTGVGHEIVAGASEVVDKEIGIWFTKF